MKINPKYLHSVETLARVQNFRVAAEILCISQPALSKQIKNVEEAYDIELFIRDNHGATLSETGKQIIDEIIALNRHIQKTNDHILSVAQNHFASLSIGFGKSSNDFLPGYIREFKNKHNNISISLSDICSYEQEEQLLSGSLDIGFMRQPKSKILHSIPVSSDEFVLAIAKDLYTKNQIDYYLENFNLLMMSNHSKSMMNMKTMALLKGRAHNITNISADIQTIITLILSNAGVAILPKKSILGIYDAIKLIPFEEDTRWDIHMAWNPARTSKSVDLFIEYVQAASVKAGGLFEKV